jgi:biopolymer transport protein TolR
MGIGIGGAKAGVVSDPNIVPLIDVLLVLIIIFMVITPTVSNGLPVAIPQPAPPRHRPLPPESGTVVVQVMPDGKVLINHDQTDWNSLGARLATIFAQRADKIAFVAGAREVPFAQVARAIAIMQGAGIDRVGLITVLETSDADFGK